MKGHVFLSIVFFIAVLAVPASATTYGDGWSEIKNPDGTFTRTFGISTYFDKTSGEWKPSNLNLSFDGTYYSITQNRFEAYFDTDLSKDDVIILKNGTTTISFSPKSIYLQSDAQNATKIQTPSFSASQSRATYKNAYGLNTSLNYTVTDSRLKEDLILYSNPYPSASPSDTFVFKQQFNFSGADMYVGGVLWDKNTPLSTSGEVEFRKNGETVFKFDKPVAYDANENMNVLEYDFSSKNGIMNVKLNVPMSWLRNATYPVAIDPTTTFGASGDVFIAESQPNTNKNRNEADSMLQVRLESGYSTMSYVKFDLSSIPYGSSVSSASLTLYWTGYCYANGNCVPDSGSYDTMTANIYRVTGSWTESGLTWNNAPSNSSPVTDSISIGGTSNGVWNVASDVDWFVTNSSNTNNGWKISTPSSVTNSPVFCSKEDRYGAYICVTSGSESPALSVTYTSPYSPPSPTNLANTTGNFFVNHTWQAGSGNITNSYNVSQNGTWINGSGNTFYNASVGGHGWSNITVWAWNNTAKGTLSSSSISMNTQVPNNVATYSNVALTPSAPAVSDNLSANYSITDLDGDTVTNTTLWYKNSVLQTALNNSRTAVASGNTTLGETWYFTVLGNDGYEDSSTYTSNSVIIGSTNSAPTFSGISLSPSTIKYNKTVYVNASGISDDSTTWQAQVYYTLANGTNVYLVNSSWVNTTFINQSFLNSFATGGAHTIRAVIYDSGNTTGAQKLTSSEAQATLLTDITSPTISSDSVSSTSVTVGGSVNITAVVDGQGANVSSVIVSVERPDATTANWTMTCGSGENVTCYKVYTSTSDIGAYYIRYFYPTDESGNSGTVPSSQTFSATAQSSSGGGGAGGGGGVPPTPAPTMTANITTTPAPTQAPSITFKNITSGAMQPESEIIAKCLKDSLILENECSDFNFGVVVEPMNWWTASGAFVFPFFVIGGTMLLSEVRERKRKNRALIPDVFLYFLVTVFLVAILVSAGFNMYIVNYLVGSSQYFYTFLSFGLWSSIVAVVGDYYGYKKYQKRILVWT